MEKRKRDRQQKFWITSYEEELIENKMKQVGISNRSAYYRKMAIDGYVILQDYDAMRKATYELNKIGTNLNQITKLANQYGTQTILTSDIQKLKEGIEKIWRTLSLKD